MINLHKPHPSNILKTYLVKQIQTKLKEIYNNEYLETCKQLNRESEKVYKGVFNVRIDPKLHKSLYKNALKSGLSLNSYIQKALQ